MAFCIECGTDLEEDATACPSCGHPTDAPPVAQRQTSTDGEDAGDAPEVVAVRILGIFAVIGFGLGMGTLLFLWATGFFSASGPGSAEDFAEVAVGAFVSAIVSAFAVLIGVVVAAGGGVYAANHSTERLTAMRIGAVGSAAGHFALVLIVVGFLLAGLALRSVSTSASADARRTQASQTQIAECERVLGAGSQVCREDLTQAPPQLFAEVDEDVDWPSIADVARFGVGIIPATIVGALSAAVAFSRRAVTAE